jgi:hypothetical protein
MEWGGGKSECHEADKRCCASVRVGLGGSGGGWVRRMTGACWKVVGRKTENNAFTCCNNCVLIVHGSKRRKLRDFKKR